MLRPTHDPPRACRDDNASKSERNDSSRAANPDNLISYGPPESESSDPMVAKSEMTEILAQDQESKADRSRLRRSNRRIALTLLALSTVFFAGVILTRLSGNSRIGLMFLGAAILLFLITAIGRNLRK